MNDYTVMLPRGPEETPYRCLTRDHVSTVEVDGRTILKVEPEALSLLARTAMADIAHLLRPGHLAQLRTILEDPEATANDRFVATELLKNANIAAGRVLPSCQDTGTAIVVAKKGEDVFTGADDEAALAAGIERTYLESNLRYSQLAPLSMYEEKNTGNNLPAQIEIYATRGGDYEFLFLAKGGGSANKTFLYQMTKAVLNPESMLQFLDEKMRSLGTAACPPYHLAIVIGGTSAEYNLKTVKLASARYLDSLPTSGSPTGHGFRDLEMEQQVLEISRKNGIGAQFGGKDFCHDVRVIRLPRHGASCPIGIGVSCSADRQALGKITKDGVFLEQLETNPAQYLPEVTPTDLAGDVVEIDLNVPMQELRNTLSQHPIKTRLSLSGSIVVARDIAHAKLKERIDSGQGLPQVLQRPHRLLRWTSEDPQGLRLGFVRSDDRGTHGRLRRPFPGARWQHGHARQGQPLSPGDRSVQEARRVLPRFHRRACRPSREGLHQEGRGHRVQEELGMEAVFRIDVQDFPAFIVVDDKGNDFFADI